MSQWVGQAEKNVAAMFASVRSYKRAVLFIDELDSLCPSRRKNHSTVMQRVISEFLTQLDGLDGRLPRSPREGFFLMMAATNWPEALDEAILRPGRFDVRVFVGLPDLCARRQILEHRLVDLPLADDVSMDEIVAATEGFSGADIVELVHAAAQNAFLTAIANRAGTQPISSADFQRALSRVRPSVSPAEMQRYLTFGSRCARV
jgi:transitional endoplasmic reticulum ATPase